MLYLVLPARWRCPVLGLLASVAPLLRLGLLHRPRQVLAEDKLGHTMARRVYATSSRRVEIVRPSGAERREEGVRDVTGLTPFLIIAQHLGYTAITDARLFGECLLENLRVKSVGHKTFLVLRVWDQDHT